MSHPLAPVADHPLPAGEHPARLYHGGVSGLRPGDLLVGGHTRTLRDDCPTCVARAAGQPLLEPLTVHQDRVYLTPVRLYAKHYASLYGRGDVYVVEPVEDLFHSVEDSIATYSTGQARVLKVYERAVLLTWTERRRLFRQWGDADREVGWQ